MKKKLKEENNYFSIFLRYLLIIAVAVPNLYLFYLVLTPLTFYPVYLLLNLFFNPIITSSISFSLGSIPIEIIDACVAGSAYYLLFMLNLAIPNISFSKRIKMIFSSFLLLLILNILRIVFLSILAYSGSNYFDITHKLFWYLLSTVFVVSIWFWEVSFFKVKGIPFYEDLKFMISRSIFVKKVKSKNRKYFFKKK